MINTVEVLNAVIAMLIVFVGGFAVGYEYRNIREALTALKTRQDAIDQDQADKTPDVVAAKTPQQVRESKFDDDSESAIIDALSPKEIAERKKQQTLKDIERQENV